MRQWLRRIFRKKSYLVEAWEGDYEPSAVQVYPTLKVDLPDFTQVAQQDRRSIKELYKYAYDYKADYPTQAEIAAYADMADRLQQSQALSALSPHRLPQYTDEEEEALKSHIEKLQHQLKVVIPHVPELFDNETIDEIPEEMLD